MSPRLLRSIPLVPAAALPLLRHAPIVALLLLAVAAVPAACAQSFAWGVQAGAGPTWAPPKRDPLVGPNAAVLGDLNPESMFGLRGSVGWARRAAAGDMYWIFTDAPGPPVQLEQDWATAAVLLRASAPFGENGRPTLIVGFEFERRVHQRVVQPHDGTDEGAILPADFRHAPSSSTGLVLAFAIEGHAGGSTVGGELRYWRDFSNAGIDYPHDLPNALTIALNWWPRWTAPRPAGQSAAE